MGTHAPSAHWSGGWISPGSPEDAKPPMPALATRFTGGTPQPRVTAPLAQSRAAGPRELVSARLSDEFLTVPVETVDRCVEDVWVCAAHLGVDVTMTVVERIAREHLIALVSSAPLVDPSG
jgi:hypothetical protein